MKCKWLVIAVVVAGCGTVHAGRTTAVSTPSPWSTNVPSVFISKPHPKVTTVVPPAVPNPPVLVVTQQGVSPSAPTVKATAAPKPTVKASTPAPKPTTPAPHVTTTPPAPVPSKTTPAPSPSVTTPVPVTTVITPVPTVTVSVPLPTTVTPSPT